MERKNTILVIATIVVLICAGAGMMLLPHDDSSDDSGEITVTDIRGREVSLPGDVQRIACLSAGSVRLATYLDAQDMIVGVDDMDAGINGPPAHSPRWSMATYRLVTDTSEIKCVGGEDNFKEIMETGAEVIFSTAEDPKNLDTLQSNTGIPVVGLSAQGEVSVIDESFKENVKLMGEALGRESRAQELLDGIDAMVKELSGYASAVKEKPRCYVGGMFFMMKGNLLKTSGNYLPFLLAGVDNAMPDKDGKPYDTDIKTLSSCGAEYMFIDSITMKDSKAMFDQHRDELGKELKAVQDGHVYSTYTYKFYGTNWETELMNAYFIGSVVHPDIYKYDLSEKVDAVLDLFYPGSGLTGAEINEKQSPGASELDW